MSSDELDAVRERYARRAPDDDRYHPLRPEVMRERQGRERALAAILRAQGMQRTGELAVTEVGCGSGATLLDLLRLGFSADRLTGIELLPGRLAQARVRLPGGVRLLAGDAAQAAIEPGSQDIVLQSTVFSSLLDDAFQQRLADAMWRWVRPGGGVLWYDFVFDNPRNTDVRGVPLRRVVRLFPLGTMTRSRRLTLAPPLARRLPAALLPVLDVLPWLRTHRLCWIGKPLHPEP